MAYFNFDNKNENTNVSSQKSGSYFNFDAPPAQAPVQSPATSQLPAGVTGEPTIRQWNPTLLDKIKSWNVRDAILSGVPQSIIGGVANNIFTKISDVSYQKAAEKGQLPYGILETPKPYQPQNIPEKVFQFAGSMAADAPIMAFNPGAKLVSKAALNPVAKTAISEGITGGALGATQGVVTGESPSEIAQRAAFGTVLGGALGGATAGIPKLPGAIRDFKLAKETSNINIPIQKVQEQAIEGIPVYRGFSIGETAKDPNLVRAKSIVDVLNDIKGTKESGINKIDVEYYTESPDVAKRIYADQDTSTFNSLVKNYGKEKAEQLFEQLYGRKQPIEGTVKQFNINPKKVLDLTDLGETPNSNKLINRLLELEGSSIPKGRDVNAPEWQRFNEIERKFALNKTSEEGILEPWRLLRNYTDKDTSANEFVDWLKANGYDAVRYAENGTNHYAVLDTAIPNANIEIPNILKSLNKTKSSIPITEPVGTKRLSFPDTVANGEIANPELAKKITETELNYGNITNKDTLGLAQDYIKTNRDDAFRIVMSDEPATAESNAIAQLLIKEANDAGNYDTAISIIEKTANKAKTQGQAIQALSMWGRLSPEGVLKYASNTIEKAKTPKQVEMLNKITNDVVDTMSKVSSEAAETVVREIEKGLAPKVKETAEAIKRPKQSVKTPALSEDIIKKLDEIETSAKARIQANKGRLSSLPVDVWADYALVGSAKLGKGIVKFSNWSAEMIKDFGEEIKPYLEKIWEQSKQKYNEFAKSNKIAKLEIEPEPEELLANKINAIFKEGEQKEKDAVKAMVDTLYKVAKESPLPEKEKLPTDPLEFIADAIKNRTQYKEVWNKAKEIVEEKFKDNPEILEELDAYINKGIEPTFSESQLNRVVGKALKDSNVNLANIVRQHYSVGNKVGSDLVASLVQRAGLSGEDAAILGKYVSKRMDELTKIKKEQILSQMFKTRIAPKQKDVSRKIIELSNLGGFQNQKYQSLIAEKLGIPTLDEATAKSLVEQANKIQSLSEGREKQVAIAKMLDTVAEKVPVSMMQKVGTLHTMAQLLNPKTAIRNVIGNAGFAGMENVSNVIGAGIDKTLSLATKQRTRVLPSIGTQIKGAKEGWKLGLEDAIKGIDTSGIKTQFDLNPTRTFRSGILGKLETAMNVELRAPDRAFYQAAYDESLRNQMKAARATEPTEAMKEIADYDGLYRTFQDDSKLATIFSGLKKLLNFNNPFDKSGKQIKQFGIGDFIIKYPKTPGNLLSRGIDYSPAGFVKIVMEAAQPLMGKGFNQRAFVDAFSRAIVGSAGLVGTGALLHKVGIITGSPNQDIDAATMERQVGLGEYRINVSALKRFILNGFNPKSAKLQKGDMQMSYDWYQPNALPLAMGADIDKNGASTAGFVGTLLNGLATGVNAFAEQPVMQGLNTLFGQKDFSGGMMQILQGVPASFIPTVLNQVRQLLDNQKRNAYSPNWFEKTFGMAMNRIPGLESTLQPTYETLGKKAEVFQDKGNNPLNVFLNPAFVSKYNPTKEEELAMNTYKTSGETKQIPTVLPKYFTVGGRRFDLSPKEYANMQKLVGELTQKGFSRISSSGNTDDQIKKMTNVIEDARREGKEMILKQRKIKYTKSGNTLKLNK